MLQTFYDDFDRMQVISDCRKGQALVLGPAGVSHGCLRSDAEYKKFDRDLAASPLGRAEAEARGLARGGKLELPALLARYTGQIDAAKLVGLKRKVGLAIEETRPRHQYDLGCGCKLLYPKPGS